MGGDGEATPPKRQRGSDIREKPQPPVAPPASDGLIAVGRIAIVFTVVAWLTYVFAYFITGIINSSYQNHIDFLVETIVYVGITSVLALSALLYLVARQGALYRSRAHRRVPRAVIDSFFDTTLPTLTVLVPSYREEIAVVRKTLLSATLQEYPFLRVVLLLDDPPNPTSVPHRELLDGARRLPAELMEWLTEPRERFAVALEEFEMSELEDPEPEQVLAQMRALAADFAWADNWLRMRMAEEVVIDHVDKFFVEQVLGALADDFASVGRALTEAADEDSVLPRARMLQLHRRLAWSFRGEVTWFERKIYWVWLFWSDIRERVLMRAVPVRKTMPLLARAVPQVHGLALTAAATPSSRSSAWLGSDPSGLWQADLPLRGRPGPARADRAELLREWALPAVRLPADQVCRCAPRLRYRERRQRLEADG